MTTPRDPLSHDAPLLWLVKDHLHSGTTLAERVRRLRYKRRKPRATEAEVAL